MRPTRVRVALFGLATSTAACHPPAAATPPATSDVWRYDLEVPADGQTLDVDVEIASDSPRVLTIDDPARAYVQGLAILHGRAVGDTVQCDPPRCSVRYRFGLEDAASHLRDPEVVAGFAGAYVGPASALLLHPADVVAHSVSLFVRSDGPAVLVPFPPARDGAPNAYELRDAGLDDSPLLAIGRWRTELADVDGAAIQIGVTPGAFGMTESDVTRWVTSSLSIVTKYLGGSSVARPLVLMVPGDGDAIDGKTLGGGGGSILIQLGPAVTARTAAESWVLVHEMIHLELPSLGPPHEWLEEGLATYVEPIARAQAGAISPERVWADWLRDGAQGLPAAGDEGLERTHTWARTYWGGALYCLKADVEIRSRTNNQRSLRDALRAIARASRGVAERWTIDRFITTGDLATGTHVMRELFDRLALAPGSIDLDALWRALGIARVREGVVFDDRAPLGAVRRAMTAP